MTNFRHRGKDLFNSQLRHQRFLEATRRIVQIVAIEPVRQLVAHEVAEEDAPRLDGDVLEQM